MKEVRPTSGKVLQALFNILGPLEGQSFLDLFAGTGRVTLEAWRRGARPVCAVELVRGRCEALLPLAGERELGVWFLDVRQALRRLKSKKRVFDVVFADPPYQSRWVATLLELLADHVALMHGRSRLVIECSLREPLPVLPARLSLVEERHYGETVLSFLRPVV